MHCTAATHSKLCTRLPPAVPALLPSSIPDPAPLSGRSAAPCSRLRRPSSNAMHQESLFHAPGPGGVHKAPPSLTHTTPPHPPSPPPSPARGAPERSTPHCSSQHFHGPFTTRACYPILSNRGRTRAASSFITLMPPDRAPAVATAMPLPYYLLLTSAAPAPLMSRCYFHPIEVGRRLRTTICSLVYPTLLHDTPQGQPNVLNTRGPPGHTQYSVRPPLPLPRSPLPPRRRAATWRASRLALPPVRPPALSRM